MKSVLFGAACAVAMAFAGAAHAAGDQDCSSKASQSFWAGGSGGGVEPARKVRSRAFSVPKQATREEIDGAVQCLQTYYLTRARRQQTWLNSGSNVVKVGILGAGLSADAGAATQRIWGLAAGTPVLLSSTEGYEPTRELYEAGAAGIDVLRQRYDDLRKATGLAEGDMNRLNSLLNAGVREACADAEKQEPTIRNWPTSGPRALAREVESVREKCRQAREIRDTLSRNTNALTVVANQLDTSLARDVNRLNDEILSRDREIAPTPFNSFTRFAAAPFLTLGATLAGTTPTAAAGLGDSGPLSNLDVPITPVDIYDLPARANSGPMLSPEAAAAVNTWKTTVLEGSQATLEAKARILREAGRAQTRAADNQRRAMAAAPKPKPGAAPAAPGAPLDPRVVALNDANATLADANAALAKATDDLADAKASMQLEGARVDAVVNALVASNTSLNAYNNQANFLIARLESIRTQARMNTLQIRVASGSKVAHAQLAYVDGGAGAAVAAPAAAPAAAPPM